MASLSQVGIEFVTQGGSKAIGEIESFTRQTNVMAKSASSAASVLNQKIKRLYDQADAYRENTKYIQQLNATMLTNAKAAQDVVNAAAGVTNTYKSAEASASVFAQQLDRVEKANLAVAQSFGDTVRAVQTANLANKSAEASASVFAQQLDRVEKANLAVAQSFGDTVRAVQTANLANKSAADSMSVFVAEQDRAKASYNQLRASIDPAYAAQMRMKQAHDVVRRALEQGIISRDQAAQSLRQYRAAANDMNGVVSAATRGQSRLGVVFQQAGYQIGDFAVQVQSGTHYMVAMGQQLTQLVGVGAMLARTTKWIAAFSALGIIVPIVTAVAGGLLRAREESKKFEGTTYDINKAAKSAADELKSYREEVAKLSKEYKTLAEVSIDKQISKLEKEVADLEGRRAQIQSAAMQGFGASGGIYTAEELEKMTGAALDQNTQKINEQILAKKQMLYTLVLEREGLERLREVMGETNELVKKGNQARIDRNRLYLQSKRDLQTEISLQKDIAKYGEDSVEVARKRAELEARAKNYTADQTSEYVRLVLQLREVKAETKNIEVAAKTFKTIMESVDLSSLVSQADTLGARIAFAAKSAFDFALAAGNRVIYEQEVGRGRGLGRGGPSASEIQTNLPSAQLAYQPGGTAGVPPRTAGVRGGAGASNKEEKNYLKTLQEEASLKLRLVGLSEQQQRYQQIVSELIEKGLPVEKDRINKIIETEKALKEATEAEERRQAIMDSVTSNIETAMMTLVDGTASIEDAFKSMLRNIIMEIYRQQVVKPAASFLGDAIRGAFFAKGATFNNGNVTPFATGGVVSGPTVFPMKNGMGLMGEAGPEAIMPLKRTKNGKLGVATEGGSSVTVIQNNTFGGGVSRAEINAMLPKIVETTKAAVFDAQRRSVNGRGYA